MDEPAIRRERDGSVRCGPGARHERKWIWPIPWYGDLRIPSSLARSSAGSDGSASARFFAIVPDQVSSKAAWATIMATRLSKADARCSALGFADRGRSRDRRSIGSPIHDLGFAARPHSVSTSDRAAQRSACPASGMARRDIVSGSLPRRLIGEGMRCREALTPWRLTRPHRRVLNDAFEADRRSVPAVTGWSCRSTPHRYAAQRRPGRGVGSAARRASKTQLPCRRACSDGVMHTPVFAIQSGCAGSDPSSFDRWDAGFAIPTY